MNLELRNDSELLKAYKDIHKPENIWPKILVNMDTIGIKNMELYLKNYQAFLLMDTTLGFDMEKDGERWVNLPREKEWQEYVAKFQKVDANSKAVEKWKVMKQIAQ
ncbi:L-rhamnose mutarotase [Aureibaculum sp. 2210JD6-5]|uniref:L-rhamnose mutarotase n=1 Tax=Aureibaculum sp. 2210JD6-5 TaxID=3103957 RepID=UPI002AAECCA6|nr:L-rhamnose mutarotase [Aureibaculum sp. 2210JD6-5]MDY7396969.1 L-rhamnose mutarotase [Aureibaculum sp. 2210JD6-5]